MSAVESSHIHLLRSGELDPGSQSRVADSLEGQSSVLGQPTAGAGRNMLLKKVWTGEMIQQIEHLPCTQLTPFQFTGLHMAPSLLGVILELRSRSKQSQELPL